MLKLRYLLLVASWVMVFTIIYAGTYLKPFLSPHVDYFSDKSNSTSYETIDTIPLGSWQRMGGLLTGLSYSKQTFWLKTTLPTSPEVEEWHVEIPAPLLSSVAFFVQGGNGLIKDSRGKDFGKTTVYPSYRFEKPKNTEIVVYTRIEWDGMTIIPFHAMKTERAEFFSKTRLVAFGVFFGSIFTLMIYNFSIFISTRDRSYGYYCLYLLSFFITGFLYAGGATAIYAESRDLAPFFVKIFWSCQGLALLFFVALVTEFMNLKFNSPRYLRTCRIVMASVTFLLVALLFTPNLVQGMGVSTLVTVVMILLAPLLMGKEILRVFFAFAMAWHFVLATAAATLLFNTGVLNGSYISFNTMFLGVYCEAVLISFAMGKRIRVLQDEKAMVKDILSGNKAKAGLNKILEQPHGLSYELVERRVTIMFIDIVGFSVTADKLGSRDVFPVLSDLLNSITRIIKNHNGTVDRSLGDGILCFFGQTHGPDHIHAREALECGLEVQRAIFQRAANFNKNRTINPLRIGINTDKVIIGNIGGDERIDYTLIGTGVNYAQRLESSCSPFRLLIGESTYNLISDGQQDQEIFKRTFLKVKHSPSFALAWEVNPFKNSEAHLAEVERRFLHQQGKKRKFERTSAEQGVVGISIDTELGTYDILEFSLGGFGIVGSQYIAATSKLKGRLNISNPVMMQELKAQNLVEILLEVRWSHSRDSVIFEHGLLIYGLNKDQKQFIHDVLQRAVTSYQGSKAETKEIS